jgi:hypothetical protein
MKTGWQRLWVAAVVGVTALAAAWLLETRGAAANWTSLAAVDRANPGWWVWASAGGMAIVAAAAAGRDERALGLPWLLAPVLWLVVVMGWAHPLGRHAGLLTLAGLGGMGAATLVPATRTWRTSDRGIALGLFGGTAVPMMAASMHRHWWFGSGSWDLGCEVHNAYLSSRGLPPVSTVLGDVSFLGDHFLPGIYLYAPLFWADVSAPTVLALQALQLAVTAPAVFLIARRHGASKASSAALGAITGLSYGLQSAAFFDAHEITLGFGFFAAALWALETGRLGLASVLLFVFSLFKESVGPYIAGLGLYLCWRAAKEGDRRRAAFGVGWMVFGTAWFVLVTRVFMPAFAAWGQPPVSHETFTDFGPTVLEAAVGMVTHPLRAAAGLFVPDQKLASWVVTLAGAGWLCLASPSVLLAAAPLLVERFLSAKASMWHMGYHYAAPLCLYAGWAAALALGRAEAWTSRHALGRSWAERRRRSRVGWAAYLLLMGGLVTGFGYETPSNFYVWRYPYYATPERAAAYRRAVRYVRDLGRSARVAAQNRLLPHVADRAVIYRLGEWPKADVVLLAEGENAWPYPDRFPGRLARQLEQDAGWSLVFEDHGTKVFRRRSETSSPALE